MSAPAELRLSNRQRLRPLRGAALKRVLVHLLGGPLGVPRYAIGVHIVRAAPMSRLNARFLDHSGPTDVITFDHGPDGMAEGPAPGAPGAGEAAGGAPGCLHGEIYICIDVALAQAREFGTTWQDEVMRYAIHGLLHLLGHDDRRSRARVRMKRREDALVRIARGHAGAREFGARAKAPAAGVAAARTPPGRRQGQGLRRRRAPGPGPGRRR